MTRHPARPSNFPSIKQQKQAAAAASKNFIIIIIIAITPITSRSVRIFPLITAMDKQFSKKVLRN